MKGTSFSQAFSGHSLCNEMQEFRPEFTLSISKLSLSSHALSAISIGRGAVVPLRDLPEVGPCVAPNRTSVLTGVSRVRPW